MDLIHRLHERDSAHGMEVLKFQTSTDFLPSRLGLMACLFFRIRFGGLGSILIPKELRPS